MPKVSFVLPAYKKSFLAEAIKSILLQTYRDLELIVVDDDSPEKLADIVLDFKDDRLKYIKNDHNYGGKCLVEAWRKALSYATGEWCVIASDDDVYHVDFVKEMLRLAARYPSVNLFHSRVSAIDSEDKTWAVAQPRPEFESCVDMLYDRCILRCQQTLPDFMFRRSALEKIGGVVSFPRAWFSDDATWLSIARLGGCVCSPRILFSYRKSGINVSASSADVDEKIKATNQFRAWVKELCSNIVPMDNQENTILSLVKGSIDRVLDSHIAELLSRLPFLRMIAKSRRYSRSIILKSLLAKYNGIPLSLMKMRSK